jgi:hypothetical protein
MKPESSSDEINSMHGEWTPVHRYDPDIGHAAALVVGERQPADSRDPLLSVLSESVGVVCRTVTDLIDLPSARHYFFLLDEIDRSPRELLIGAVRSGARVTLIVRTVEPYFAALAEHRNVNIIPACGDTAQITSGTFTRAIKMVLAGQRVVAQGFFQNSFTSAETNAGGCHAFVAMLTEASIEANRSTTVVAAVLALQRTGSNFLRDMIGLSVSANVRMFHEHDVPTITDAALRDALLTPQRRYVFVSDRPPEDRLLSYFVRHRSSRLHRAFDASSRRFRNASEIQGRFREWAWAQVDRQRKWYRNKLLRPFGLDVLKTRAVDGLLVGRHGPNTLVVVPTVCLNRLREIVSAEFRTDCYRSLARNSASEGGDHDIDTAFREQFPLDRAITESLWTIPEVAHIHGALGSIRRPGIEMGAPPESAGSSR